jgi:hypothetical protein
MTTIRKPPALPPVLEPLSLKIGCCTWDEKPDERFVAMLLTCPDTLVSVVLKNWPAVAEVMTGLAEQGHEAWGPMPSELRYENLLVRMGELAGALSRPENHQQLTQHLESARLKAGYITLLRDQLTRVLVDSGRESEGALPGRCAECGGKHSTPNAMWALYCVDCIQKIGPGLWEKQP